MTPRAWPIIAVFGSDTEGTPELAYAVGHRLASMHCIVLTGGDGPVGTPVKNRALAGADRAACEIGTRAPWVGVGRGQREKPRVTPRSIVLNLGYGDRRNYVEARLCDAAICFVGERGTASELVFCLAVGRPLVLVDYAAGEDCPVEDARALMEFQKLAKKRVPQPEAPGSPIDRCIGEAYDGLGGNMPAHCHLSSRGPHAATHIAEAALELAGGPPFLGSFPDWDRDATARQIYERWLTAL